MEKILILAQQLEAGGIEKSIISLANVLAGNNFQVSIVTLLKSTPIAIIDEKVRLKTLTPFISDKNKKHSYLYRFFRKMISFSFLILFLLKQKEETIISSRNEYSVLLSKFGHKSIKKIAQLHHDYVNQPKLIHDFRFSYKKIDFFVQVCDQLTFEIRDIMKGYNNNTSIITIPNIVEKKTNEKNEKFNIAVSVGRFSPEKDFTKLLEIWGKIIKIQNNWKLVLVGDGPEREKITNKIKELGIEKNVELPGFVPNQRVLEILAKASLFMMTSKTESFGIVLVEAMKNYIPVVAFDVRVGPRSIITDGVNGYLIENLNDDMYVTKVLNIINNKALREEMGNNAYESSKKYSEEEILKLWKKIL